MQNTNYRENFIANSNIFYVIFFSRFTRRSVVIIHYTTTDFVFKKKTRGDRIPLKSTDATAKNNRAITRIKCRTFLPSLGRSVQCCRLGVRRRFGRSDAPDTHTAGGSTPSARAAGQVSSDLKSQYRTQRGRGAHGERNVYARREF